jgi:hypothetical protein
MLSLKFSSSYWNLMFHPNFHKFESCGLNVAFKSIFPCYHFKIPILPNSMELESILRS